ncbi:branched-subunit amino acid transport protein AzlD [Mobilisporobacter senegalensis]|uniref:Branched-subunit amino acid transport protein AzlD n=1 Tax=Mobilisporobacter senegalensis TaxID=1329262 RepID=A0A3N1XYR0_9FIRM|nr:AzlD domain-containing protein [Mobilisporobacter senegalensis]ROR31720.1 branched-subunit amino acid transport protein AzlD [Mobilisporobacter senegalensis]
MESTKALLIILIVALCTFGTRVLPFIIFRKNQELPQIVKYLGDILPMSVIAILVVYCLKGVNFKGAGGFVPSIISVATVILIHIWKRNNLISIGAGTLIYMLLIHIF